MILKGDNQEIELMIEGYEYSNPKLNNFWDYNWLMLYCRKTIKGETVSGRFASFLTTELKQLMDLLLQFLNNEIECVEWGGTEPNFWLLLEKDGLFRQSTQELVASLEIYFYSESGPEKFDEVKIFRKWVDKEDVKQLIDFCEDSLKKYPIREIE